MGILSGRDDALQLRLVGWVAGMWKCGERGGMLYVTGKVECVALKSMGMRLRSGKQVE